jgi:hypothetical protein
MIPPLYVPVAAWAYAVIVHGSVVGELFRGKAGWWLVTNNRYKRFDTLRDAESRIRLACEKLEARA